MLRARYVRLQQTLDQAIDELKDAVALQLNEVQRMGFLEAYLKDRNVRGELVEGNYPDEWALAKTGTL